MDTQTCTRCRHARLWTITPPRNPSSPLEIKKGWITCDFRKWEASPESGAPFRDAFPEFSEICDMYEEIK